MLEVRISRHIDLLMERYPVLKPCMEDIEAAYRIKETC